jgi:hypothetical protein
MMYSRRLCLSPLAAAVAEDDDTDGGLLPRVELSDTEDVSDQSLSDLSDLDEET